MNLNLSKFSRFLTISLLACFALGVSSADDIKEAIEDGMKAYDEGDYKEAATSLEIAVQMIREMRGGNMTQLLPEPLDGWTADEASSETMGAAMFGGGTTLERNYSKDNSEVTISIVGDSPMIQSMGMLFNNPMLASGSGMKFKKINGERVLVEFEDGDDSGEITAFLNGKWLVTISGDGVTLDDLIAYAELVPFEKLGES